jgi:hypothetical protein
MMNVQPFDEGFFCDFFTIWIFMMMSFFVMNGLTNGAGHPQRRCSTATSTSQGRSVSRFLSGSLRSFFMRASFCRHAACVSQGSN